MKINIVTKCLECQNLLFNKNGTAICLHNNKMPIMDMQKIPDFCNLEDYKEMKNELCTKKE